MRTKEPGSAPPRMKGQLTCEGDAGRLPSRRTGAGAFVSTVNELVAGVGSGVPTKGSVARAATVCGPSASAAGWNWLEQVVNAEPSTLHSNPACESSDANVKLGVAELV